MDFQDVGWGSMDWIVLVEDMGKCRALMNAVINFVTR